MATGAAIAGPLDWVAGGIEVEVAPDAEPSRGIFFGGGGGVAGVIGAVLAEDVSDDTVTTAGDFAFALPTTGEMTTLRLLKVATCRWHATEFSASSPKASVRRRRLWELIDPSAHSEHRPRQFPVI